MAFNRLPLEQKLITKASWIGACLVWHGERSKRGYGLIRLKGKKRRAHRISYEFHCGPIPKGMHLLHSCDNPACINPMHLSPGTQLDNVRDMWAKGRATIVAGERNGMAKLTAENVEAIRARHKPYDRTNSARALAREFGVVQETITAIIRRESWK